MRLGKTWIFLNWSTIRIYWWTVGISPRYWGLEWGKQKEYWFRYRLGPLYVLRFRETQEASE